MASFLEEKGEQIAHIEHDSEKRSRELQSELVSESPVPEFDARETRRILRKIDWRLVPFLALLYL